MWSFLSGIGCAAILAAGTLWVLEAGTITMMEESDALSSVIKHFPSEGTGGFGDPGEQQ